MTSSFSKNDSHFMAIALQLARKGSYGVKANPMVGCVITKDGKVIAQGYHQTFGEEHAEIKALEQINHQADGATFYITLEPCAHHGKTPPCTQAIIGSGAKKVVIAMLDPNPLVCGKGANTLKDSGIEVLTGLMEDEALILNRGFIKRMQTGIPFVSCKIAMSLDGKTSMKSGESKWITSETARQDVQYLRANHQAIMTGSGTILADNPSMSVRLDGIDSSPLRVVIDSKDRINDQTLNIFSNDAPTIVLNTTNTKTLNSGKIDLSDALKYLGDQGINNVLLEAGPGLVGAMIEDKLIDEFIIYTAPVFMGSEANSAITLPIKTMADKIRLSITDIRMVGNDIRMTAKIQL